MLHENSIIKRLLLLIYVLFLLYNVIIPSPFYEMNYYDYFLRFSNLIPLKTIIGYLNGLINGYINTILVVKNLIGNLFLFTPLIYFIGGDKRIKNNREFYSYCIVIIIVFEILQIVFKSGSMDIDDLILNFFGIFVVNRIYLNYHIR